LKFSGGAPAKQAETEARAGKNSFPPTPFLFARPSEFFSKVSVGIFLKKGSDFIQDVQHTTIFLVFTRFLRLAAPRLGAVRGQISETFFALWAKKI